MILTLASHLMIFPHCSISSMISCLPHVEGTQQLTKSLSLSR